MADIAALAELERLVLSGKAGFPSSATSYHLVAALVVLGMTVIVTQIVLFRDFLSVIERLGS